MLIDEIGDIPEELQARIVRMMDTPVEYAPRFLATSQTDLAAVMEAGRVRKDLYYRLSGATLKVPALRERVEKRRLRLAPAHWGTSDNNPPARYARAISSLV